MAEVEPSKVQVTESKEIADEMEMETDEEETVEPTPSTLDKQAADPAKVPTAPVSVQDVKAEPEAEEEHEFDLVSPVENDYDYYANQFDSDEAYEEEEEEAIEAFTYPAEEEFEGEVEEEEEEELVSPMDTEEMRLRREYRKEKRKDLLASFRGKTFVPLNKQAQMLKTSMRFVPKENIAPNIYGHPWDPPYLFKTLGRDAYFDDYDSSNPNLSCKPQASTAAQKALMLQQSRQSLYDPSTCKMNEKIEPIGFPCPTGGRLLEKAHQNMLVAFMNYYNSETRVRNGQLSPDIYKPWLRIGCHMQCCKPRNRIPRSYASSNVSSDDNNGLLTESAERLRQIEKDKYYPPPGFKGPFPMFPDPKTVLKVPPEGLPGYLDQFGTFHLAVFGDNIPPGCVLGYVDSDGVFQPIISLEEGIKNEMIPQRKVLGPPVGIKSSQAQLSKRIHSRKLKDPDAKSLHWNDSIRDLEEKLKSGMHQSENKFQAKGSELPVFPESKTRIRKKKSKSKRNKSSTYILEDEDPTVAAEEPKVESSPKPVEGHGLDSELAGGMYISADGHIFTDSSFPTGRGKAGSLDGNGVFREVKVGEPIPEGELAGWMDENGVFNPAKALPKGQATGYLDANAKFVKLAPGQQAPPGSNIGITDEKGVFHPANTMPKTNVLSYLNDKGVSVELKAGEKAPPGSIVGIKDDKGVFRPRSSLKDSSGNTITLEAAKTQKQPVIQTKPNVLAQGKPDAEILQTKDSPPHLDSELAGGMYISDDGQVFTDSSFPTGRAKAGSLDGNGVFHELKPGQPIPEGELAGWMDDNGVFNPAKVLPKGQATGYLDSNAKFVKLAPGQQAPPGSNIGIMNEKGVFQPADTLPKTNALSYLDDKGASVELKPGETAPPGSIVGIKDDKGVFRPRSSLKDSSGNAITLEAAKTQAQPVIQTKPTGKPEAAKTQTQPVIQTKPTGKPDAEIVQTKVSTSPADGHNLDSELAGGMYISDDGQVFTDSSFPTGRAKAGSLDGNGIFHEVKPGQPIPEGELAGWMDENGVFNPAKALPKGQATGYLDANAKFVKLAPGQQAPPGSNIGIMDEKGEFQSADTMPKTNTLSYLNEKGASVELKPGQKAPPGSIVGIKDDKGVFRPRSSLKDSSGNTITLEAAKTQPQPVIQTKPTVLSNEKPDTKILQTTDGPPQPDSGLTGGMYVSDDGQVFTDSSFPTGRAKAGSLDGNGVFHEVKPGQPIPKGESAGWMDEKGVFNPAKVLPKGQATGYLDANAKFVKLAPGQQAPPGSKIGIKNEKGVFQPADTLPKAQVKAVDQKTPVKSKQPKVEDPNEVVEVEIHDEKDLDENGKPKVKIVLRNRGSIQAPPDATPTPDGGLTWKDGNEQVTELPYYDSKDLDDKGQPKLKKMRVRTVIDDTASKASLKANKPKGRTRQRGPLPSNVSLGEEQELREVPLTEAERERLIEFQRGIAVQCDLDFVDGSLDLGEVFRKSFRIYSHGGSIDIDDPNAPPQKQTASMETDATLDKTQSLAVVKQKSQKSLAGDKQK